MAMLIIIQVHVALQDKSKVLCCQFKACNCLIVLRSFMSKVDWKKLRPFILERIKQRVNYYPLKSMIPVAHDVLNARDALMEGVSKLLKVIPVKACRHCSELNVGHIGHQIQTCRRYKRGAKNVMHEWIEGGINDILVPVESFHLHGMFQNVIEHDERFDFYRVPAVLELCIQAGIDLPECLLNRANNYINFENGLTFHLSNYKSDKVGEVLVNVKDEVVRSPSFVAEELRALAQRTLQAWERMRLGTKKLMLVYPVRVCESCPEVHVGPLGHKVQLCDAFRHQALKRQHRWKHAHLDDLIPSRIVWHVREQDVPPLLDKWRGYYGHAPAVVELCVQGGATIPRKYHCMMKINGLIPASDYPSLPLSIYLSIHLMHACLLFFLQLYDYIHICIALSSYHKNLPYMHVWICIAAGAYATNLLLVSE